ncbi:VanZ family protein [Methylomicrobium sp. Wu6]|uniref:VanZ family protein n=1 Tax=Methylomicrobium sp. Wu6 TaxID=3107928 RepID=UPI002DD6B24B|nr:VanZ family protein [Methylomicrobium sp. Wu6]MEC4747754.1 VanZ family protein [Methylomicrobium sp. Wu6]
MMELQGSTALHVSAPWDKLVHASVYGFLSALLWWGLDRKHRFWRLLALMAVLGMGHEYFQSYLPGRTSSVWDWLADVIGSWMVLLFLVLAKRKGGNAEVVYADN